MLQIVGREGGREGKIVIPMSEALRAAAQTKRQKNLGTTNHARNYVGWGLFFEHNIWKKLKFTCVVLLYVPSHCHLLCVMYSRSMYSLCSLRNDKQQLVPKNPKFSKKCFPKKPKFAKKA
jgi:hypothetical protein